jgi:hypothetical protein
MRCPVEDCTKKLDDRGRPLEFCDYQQGRCPMQKHTLDVVGVAVIIGMFTMLGLVIWLTT